MTDEQRRAFLREGARTGKLATVRRGVVAEAGVAD